MADEQKKASKKGQDSPKAQDTAQTQSQAAESRIYVVALRDGYGGMPNKFRKQGERFYIASEAELGRWMKRIDPSAESATAEGGATSAAGKAKPTGEQQVI